MSIEEKTAHPPLKPTPVESPPATRVSVTISLPEDIVAILSKRHQAQATSLASRIEYLLTRSAMRNADAALTGEARHPPPLTKEDRWEQELDPASRLFLDAAGRKGMLGAFTAAVKARIGNASNEPGNLRKFFLTFLRTAAPVSVPAYILNGMKKLQPIPSWFSIARRE